MPTTKDLALRIVDIRETEKWREPELNEQTYRVRDMRMGSPRGRTQVAAHGEAGEAWFPCEVLHTPVLGFMYCK